MLSVALVFVLGGGVFAQSDTGMATVEIVPIANDGGTLSVAIINVDFGEHEYRLTDHTVNGKLSIYASDMRGTAGGWTVTLAGTDLNSSSYPTLPISIGNLYSPAGTVCHIGDPSGHPTDAPPVPVASWLISHSPVAVLSAVPGTGAGIYENSRAGTLLNIPGGTLIGEYKSTLTITISGEQP